MNYSLELHDTTLGPCPGKLSGAATQFNHRNFRKIFYFCRSAIHPFRCIKLVTIALCICCISSVVHALKRTWVSGSDKCNQIGIYGTKGVTSPNNAIGARYGAVLSYDSIREEFWLFGGYGFGNGTIFGKNYPFSMLKINLRDLI